MASPNSTTDHRHPVVVHESINLCAALRKAYRKHLGSPRKIFSWRTLQIIRPVSMSTTVDSVRIFKPALADECKTWSQIYVSLHHCKNFTMFNCAKSCANWCRYFKDMGIWTQWSRLILQLKRQVLPGGTTGVINLFNKQGGPKNRTLYSCPYLC